MFNGRNIRRYRSPSTCYFISSSKRSPLGTTPSWKHRFCCSHPPEDWICSWRSRSGAHCGHCALCYHSSPWTKYGLIFARRCLLNPTFSGASSSQQKIQALSVYACPSKVIEFHRTLSCLRLIKMSKKRTSRLPLPPQMDVSSGKRRKLVC